MTKKQIVIDYTRFAEFCQKRELFVSDKDEMIELAADKGARLAAFVALISRAEGIAPEDILKGDRVLWMDGGAANVHYVISNIKIIKEKEGKQRKLRKYNTSPAQRTVSAPDPDDIDDALDNDEEIIESVEYQMTADEPHYAEVGSAQNVENAIKGLDVGIGHIRNRLAEIYIGNGDVEGQAELLKQKIDGIVLELVNGGSQAQGEIVVDVREKVKV